MTYTTSVRTPCVVNCAPARMCSCIHGIRDVWVSAREGGQVGCGQVGYGMWASGAATDKSATNSYSRFLRVERVGRLRNQMNGSIAAPVLPWSSGQSNSLGGKMVLKQLHVEGCQLEAADISARLQGDARCILRNARGCQQQRHLEPATHIIIRGASVLRHRRVAALRCSRLRAAGRI